MTRLGPARDDNYFDDTSKRFIEYTVRINGQPQFRRINFWQYTPRKSTQPYLYFDTSRHPADGRVRSTGGHRARLELGPDGTGLHVHAFKKQNATASPNQAAPFQYIDPEGFQILHCGDDDEWGEDAV